MAEENRRAAVAWEKWVETLRLPLTFAAVPVLFVALGDAVFAPTPSSEHPGFIDTLLGSHAVIVAIRLAIISAAAFVVISILALIKRRQWLIRVGSVGLGTGNRS
jgi:hypothetical protein